MTGGRTLQVRLTARVGSLLLDVDIDTGPGTLVLLGPNGAGKTSLLSLVLGALPVTHGRIAVGNDVLLDTARGVDVAMEERRLGYVPQDTALFPHLSVRGNIEFAVGSAQPGQPRTARALQVARVLQELGLEALADRSTRTLSGGEQQRVALARALAVGPRALLLDEPLTALDAHARGEVRALLATTLTTLALPTIVVTHDAADARALGHRVAVLEAGKITQVGTWSELEAAPASRFVADFVGGWEGPS